MAASISLAAAARSLRGLAAQAPGGVTRERIERLAGLAEDAKPTSRELNLGAVAGVLFPAARDPVEAFRGFRRDLRELALAQDVDLACEVDGHKHARPDARTCWFVGRDDGVRQLEHLTDVATSSASGDVEVPARGRRAVRICIDATDEPRAADLATRLRDVLAVDSELEVEVIDTRAPAGVAPDEVRVARLRRADVVVCLLSHAYLKARTDRDFGRAMVMPVLVEHLGAGTDLRGFSNPFALDGADYESCRRKTLFATALRDQIAARLAEALDPVEHDWDLLVGEPERGPLVDARALRTQLDRRPPSRAALDDTVDVQDYLRSWADGDDDRPYLVIFGEYGMGKTTASQVLARGLLKRRRAGDGDARLPIYLDLRRLGDVKHREPSLEAILEDLLRRVWQAGGSDPPTAAEVIDHVQRRRAVVIFDGLDEVLVHLRETQGQALLRELWKILPPTVLDDPDARRRTGRVVMTCRTHFFRTLRDQHAYFRGDEREIVGAGHYAALHLLPFTPEQVRTYLERRDGAGDAEDVERALELIRTVHNLSELVGRPFNLRLIADQLGTLERRIASGERVDTAALYAELVETWLDRDRGKHQLEREHKKRLMGELAAELWRDGRRSLPVDRLEAWLHRRLDRDDELGRWFRLKRDRRRRARGGSAHRDVRRATRRRRVRVRAHVAAGVLPRAAPCPRAGGRPTPTRGRSR